MASPVSSVLGSARSSFHENDEEEQLDLPSLFNSPSGPNDVMPEFEAVLIRYKETRTKLGEFCLELAQELDNEKLKHVAALQLKQEHIDRLMNDIRSMNSLFNDERKFLQHEIQSLKGNCTAKQVYLNKLIERGEVMLNDLKTFALSQNGDENPAVIPAPAEEPEENQEENGDEDDSDSEKNPIVVSDDEECNENTVTEKVDNIIRNESMEEEFADAEEDFITDDEENKENVPDQVDPLSMEKPKVEISTVKDTAKIWECRFCDDIFKKKASLLLHKANVHKIQPKKKAGKPKLASKRKRDDDEEEEEPVIASQAVPAVVLRVHGQVKKAKKVRKVHSSV